MRKKCTGYQENNDDNNELHRIDKGNRDTGENKIGQNRHSQKRIKYVRTHFKLPKPYHIKTISASN